MPVIAERWNVLKLWKNEGYAKIWGTKKKVGHAILLICEQDRMLKTTESLPLSFVLTPVDCWWVVTVGETSSVFGYAVK